MNEANTYAHRVIVKSDNSSCCIIYRSTKKKSNPILPNTK